MRILGEDTYLLELLEIISLMDRCYNIMDDWDKRSLYVPQDKVYTCNFCASILQVDILDWEQDKYSENFWGFKCPKCGKSTIKMFTRREGCKNGYPEYVHKKVAELCRKVDESEIEYYKNIMGYDLPAMCNSLKARLNHWK